MIVTKFHWIYWIFWYTWQKLCFSVVFLDVEANSSLIYIFFSLVNVVECGRMWLHVTECIWMWLRSCECGWMWLNVAECDWDPVLYFLCGLVSTLYKWIKQTWWEWLVEYHDGSMTCGVPWWVHDMMMGPWHDDGSMISYILLMCRIWWGLYLLWFSEPSSLQFINEAVSSISLSMKRSLVSVYQWSGL